MRLVADCSSQTKTARERDDVLWTGAWTEAAKQSVNHKGYVLIASCKSLTNAKVDLKPGKNTLAN